jgi:hypothetical protein
MALRKSTKIALGFALLTGGSYAAYQVITDQMIMGEKFSVLTPGDVNVVGIDPGAGYRIVVANQMAQLVQAQTDFEGKDSNEGGATEGAIKKRVPVKEMLQVLRGDAAKLGPFVMALNDMSENDNWPPERVIWKAEDLRKALDGDKTLEAKLVRDLNMNLDGMPLRTLRVSSLQNGIIVDTPVSVTVNLNGKQTPIVGRVQEPYRPRLMRAVEENYKDKPDVTREMQAGYYANEAQALLEKPEGREVVRESIESRIKESLAKQRAAAAERVLKSATIVVSDALVKGASYRTYDSTSGKLHDLTVDLTDEGRRRLWQFSKKRVGTQLLLTAEGIPIAAARIQHPLAQGEITITQLPDEVLVRSAVELLNRRKNVAQR